MCRKGPRRGSWPIFDNRIRMEVFTLAARRRRSNALSRAAKSVNLLHNEDLQRARRKNNVWLSSSPLNAGRNEIFDLDSM